MRLSDLTIEELEHHRDVAIDSIDDSDPETVSYADDVAAIESVIADPTTKRLAGHPIAMERLCDSIESMQSYGEPWSKVRPIAVDLARAGYFEKGDGRVAMGRRVKTRKIDGAEYVTGY